jgi:hypothetical protein
LTACIVGLAAGIIINRIVFGIFGAAIGALLVIVIQAGGLAPVENESPFISTWPEYEQNDTVINARTALNITVQMAGFLVDSVKKTVVSARIIHFAGAGLAVVIAVGLVVFAPRLFIAIVSSALGSAVIFTGMIILLFYKGSKPISYIAQKPHFFAMVFAAMLIFGSAVQIVLSPLQLKKSQPDSTDEDKEKNRFRTL